MKKRMLALIIVIIVALIGGLIITSYTKEDKPEGADISKMNIPESRFNKM